jgi:hypothetical protein
LPYNFAVGTAGDVTRLLREWKEGRAGAVDELLPLVYPDLRRIAYGYHESQARLSTQQSADSNPGTRFGMVEEKNPVAAPNPHDPPVTAAVPEIVPMPEVPAPDASTSSMVKNGPVPQVTLS